MASGSALSSSATEESRVRLPTRESFRCVEEEKEAVRLSPSRPRVDRPFTLSPLPPRPSHSLAGHTNRVVSFLAHPFLPLLASGSRDHTVRVWDLESRSLLHALEGHTSTSWGLAFDPSGRRLASGSDDCSVRVWDLGSGACLLALKGHSNVMAVAWDPSGSLVASGSFDRTVSIWDAESGALRRTLEGHRSPVLALAAHPTDDLLASGSNDRTVRVWRWSSRECLHSLEGHKGAVMSLAASASWLVSASWDRSVRVWSWATGECACELGGFAGFLNLSSLSWRGSALATLEGLGKVNWVCLWDTSSEDPREWSCAGSLPLNAASGNGVSSAGAGRVASTTPEDDTMVLVWGVDCGFCL